MTESAGRFPFHFKTDQMKNFLMMTTSFLVSLLSLMWACNVSPQSPDDQLKQDLQNLSGTYMDLTPYAYGDAFGQRTFTFEEGKWTLTFTLGLDPELKMPVFEFRTVGTYEVLEKSEVVPEAFEALFLEDKKYLTLQTDNPELIQAFGLGACGLIPFEEADISDSGCALWPSVQECNEDHDLLSLDAEGLLYFGVRPADNNMCTADRRPTALTPPVTKI